MKTVQTTKMTKEEFSQYLNSFNENNMSLMLASVTLIIEGHLGKEYYSEIPEFMKKSLGRKVARFIAETGVKGTFDADGLAQSCSFVKMDKGYPVSFGKENEFTFYSDLAQTVRVLIFKDYVSYYNLHGSVLLRTDIPYGCYPYNHTGRRELVELFEKKFDPETYLYEE